MTTDTNRPDAVWRDGRMTGEEREWHECWLRLRARFGRNVPTPVDMYGDPYSQEGCFVVIDNAVCTVEPVFNDDGEPVTFSPAMQKELLGDLLWDVRKRWGIPDPSVRLPYPPATP